MRRQLLGYLSRRGFANQCGVVLASSIVYFESKAAHTISYAWAMANSAALVFVLVIAVTLLAPAGKEADLLQS